MTRLSIAIAALAAFTVLAGAGLFASVEEQTPQAVARVEVSALGRQIEVIGDLGEPLEKLITLRGEMVAADHFADRARNKYVPEVERFVRVHQVDDRTLRELVVVELEHNWYRDKKPMPGTAVELIGYAILVYEGDSPIEKQWNRDPRNRHEIPPPPRTARAVMEGHYDDQFVVLQFDELPAKK